MATVVHSDTDFMQAVINSAPTPIFYKDAKGLYMGLQ